MKKPYRWIDHTADIGIEVFGIDLRELFVNSAKGMFEIIAGKSKINSTIERKIEVKAVNQEELIVAWLRELHFIYEVDQLLFAEFYIDSITDNEVIARARGEFLDNSRHRIMTEIKTVTYHQLKIEKLRKNFKARIIFDL